MSASRFELAAALIVLGTAVRAGADAGSPTGQITGQITQVKLGVGSQVDGFGSTIIYLEDASLKGKMPEGPFAVTQSGKAFHPTELIVPIGASVDFPNQDSYFHNVFSTAAGQSFDLGLYKEGASRAVTFTKPGLVPIFCNIHPQMIGYILVVTNPFYTRPDGNGRFSLPNVPPGSYHLVAWFPHGPAVRTEVKVDADHTSEVPLTLHERSGAERHRNKNGEPYTHY